MPGLHSCLDILSYDTYEFHSRIVIPIRPLFLNMLNADKNLT